MIKNIKQLGISPTPWENKKEDRVECLGTLFGEPDRHSVCRQGGFIEDEEWKADARLIAHAPELYETAYNLLAKLAYMHCDTAESRMLAEVLNKISNEQVKEGETK